MKHNIEVDDEDCALIVRGQKTDDVPAIDFFVPGGNPDDELKPHQIVLFYAAMRMNDPLFLEEAKTWITNKRQEYDDLLDPQEG